MVIVLLLLSITVGVSCLVAACATEKVLPAPEPNAKVILATGQVVKLDGALEVPAIKAYTRAIPGFAADAKPFVLSDTTVESELIQLNEPWSTATLLVMSTPLASNAAAVICWVPFDDRQSTFDGTTSTRAICWCTRIGSVAVNPFDVTVTVAVPPVAP